MQQDICVSQAAQISPHRAQSCPTQACVNGECNVPDPVLLVGHSVHSTDKTKNTRNQMCHHVTLFVLVGFYCPEGTEKPHACPGNTLREAPGGSSIHDCLPCPPRRWCKEGKNTTSKCFQMYMNKSSTT